MKPSFSLIFPLKQRFLLWSSIGVHLEKDAKSNAFVFITFRVLSKVSLTLRSPRRVTRVRGRDRERRSSPEPYFICLSQSKLNEFPPVPQHSSYIERCQFPEALFTGELEYLKWTCGKTKFLISLKVPNKRTPSQLPTKDNFE